MKRRILGKLTFANVIACIALFVALGGASYAALKLPKNSVGAKQLKKGAVTPAKLSGASKAALTGPPGPRGQQGEKGERGEKGDTAPGGATAAYSVFHDARITVTASSETGATYATLGALPAGSYEILATLEAGATSGAGFLVCNLTAEGDTDSKSPTVGTSAGQVEQASVTLQIVHTFPATGKAELICGRSGSAAGIFIGEVKITAIKVGSVANSPF